MPGSKSDYLENALLNHVFRAATWPTLPASLYVALFTTSPAEDGTGGTEVSGGGYARLAVTRNTSNWTSSTAGSLSNAVILDFGTASAAWGTINGAAIMDASTGGNILYLDNALTTPKPVTNGDPVQIPVGQASFSEA